MDVSEKDELRSGDTTVNYDDSVNNPPPDWRVSGSNQVSAPIDSYPTENLISSCSPSQMMDSFGQTLWYDPASVQAVGYGGFSGGGNASSSSTSFRGNNMDRSLEMGWNLPNLLPPKGNGMFLPNASSFMPPSMAQFPADSGFIERAARFSLFSGGSFSDMMMNQHQPPLGNPESVGLFLQGQCPSNEVGVAHNDASAAMKETNVVRSSEQAKVPGSGNVSEDTQSSGGGNGQKGGETSSKGFDSKKRKRNRQNSEADQSQRSQQSEEEPNSNNGGGDKKKKDEQSPNSQGNKSNSGKQQGKQTSDPKDGYIHVRARRGQATNSHSLAERVRREKISERMKFLQDLVPGCNKVTGKAVMLDEIINYVQSLQRQVEFLSMKLATVNPQIDFNLEGLLAKDALQLRAGTSSATPFPPNMPMVYPPLPHGFMQQTLSSMGRNISTPLSPINSGYKRQEGNGWEGDLQNVIQINYGAGDVPPDSQAAAAAASVPSSNLKVEP